MDLELVVKARAESGETAQPVKGKRGAKSSQGSSESQAALMDEVKAWGAYFGLYFNIFGNTITAFGPKPELGFTSTDPRRYKTSENQSACVILELYECLPEKLNDLMLLSTKGTKTYFASAVSISV